MGEVTWFVIVCSRGRFVGREGVRSDARRRRNSFSKTLIGYFKFR